MSKLRSVNPSFKPRARLLLLLGDQLIREPGIAVFELMKNAYDADSPYARVTMSELNDGKKGSIIIEDSGTGMDYETIMNVWLEPGTDHRSRQKNAALRTPKYQRLPLGEKGVGRFAAHKLGSRIQLTTRRTGNPEILVNVNWDDFEADKYITDVPIKVQERIPQIFTGKRTGTRIEITKLRNSWNRDMARDLFRSINSICSPFDEKGGFRAELLLTENEDWLKGLFTVDQVLEYALFRAQCDINDRQLTYKYKFRPFKAMDRVKPRIKRVKDAFIKIPEGMDFESFYVGPVHIDLYIFDLEPQILSLGVTDKKGLRTFLREVGGIRVYRDGMRVWDYGEPGNDWLNLGGRRVNVPTKRISNNIVIGAVSLQLDKSTDLVEKTNREGFVENDAFKVFFEQVYQAVDQIVAERNIDKTRIRNAYSHKKMREPVLEDLSGLRDLVGKRGLTEELGPYLDRIEDDFVIIRDRFLTSASAGLSLSVVIHEVEKGVAELQNAVKKDQPSPRIKKLAKHLADLTEGFAALIRRSGISHEKARTLIAQATFNTKLRLKIHGITLIPDKKNGDFSTKCSRRLTISTLMNLIDNSIWWLDTKWGQSKNKKQIYIGISKEFKNGRAIIVADNGPGFQDPPEYLIEPFISRKPDGMGLGLHIADQVMKAQGGRLEFPERGDLSLPHGFTGAVVALVFGGVEK